MYATTGQNHDFMSRTGSRSTAPRATGRVDVLPPQARPLEEEYQGLKAAYRDARANYDKLTAELKAMAGGHSARRDELKRMLEGAANKVGRLRKMARDAATLPYAVVWSFVASQKIAVELCNAINEETAALMERGEQELRGRQGQNDGRPAQLVTALYWQQKQACFYCDALMTAQAWSVDNLRGYTVDHVLPLRMGRTRHDNIVLSCQPCNAKKSGLIPTGAEIARAKKLIAEATERQFDLRMKLMAEGLL